MKSNPLSGRDARLMGVVAGVAFTAALLMVLVVFRRQGLVANAGDPYGYGKIAHELAEHGLQKLTRRAASLYPEFLKVIYLLGFGDKLVQLIQCLLHAGTSALTFAIGRGIFNARTGLVAGLFCAVHPMLLRYVPDLHMESWLTFWVTLTIWHAVRFDERPTPLNGVLFAVAGTIATLSKGVALPLMLAFTAVWAWRWWRRLPGAAGSLPGVAAVALTATLMIAPWSYRNYRVSGKVVLLTPGTPDAFLRGYIFTRLEFATLQRPPYTDAENESNQLFQRTAREAGAIWEDDEIVDDENNRKLAKRWIVERPFDTLRKCIVGLFTFWYEMTSLKNSLVPLSLAVISWSFAFIGFKRARREALPFWIPLLPVVVTNVFVALLIPLGRYSVPILPSLAVLAAFGVDTVMDRRKARAAHVLASQRFG